MASHDLQIKRWIDNNERFETKADGDGLCLSYRESFLTPRWNFRYRFAGKQRIMNINTSEVFLPKFFTERK